MKFTISSFFHGSFLVDYFLFFFPLHFDGHIRRPVTRVMTHVFSLFPSQFRASLPRIDSLMIGHLLLSIIISTMCFFSLSSSFFIQKKWLNFLVNERGKWTAERYYYYYYSMMCDRETTGRCITCRVRLVYP